MSKIYFGLDVQQAIIQYNESESKATRDRLFQDKIYPAFDKLAENLIHTYKFYNYDTTYQDLKNEVVTFCFRKLNRYNLENGKAYSYFSKIAYNELINKARATNRSDLQKEDLSVIDDIRDLDHEVQLSSIDEGMQDFIDQWIRWVDVNIEILFSSQSMRKAVDSILEMFRSRHTIENFNKKALYILMKSYSGVKSQYITTAKNELKTMYYEMYTDYYNNIQIDWNYYLNRYRVKK